MLHVLKYAALCRHSASTQFELDEAIVVAALTYFAFIDPHIHMETSF